MSDVEFQPIYLNWGESCGTMANLVAKSGGNKGQLSHLVEAIRRDFRLYEEAETKLLMEWQKLVKTKGTYTPRY